MKRVIAFSTCRQVATMIMARSLPMTHSRIFLLVTHATYKALIFLRAGIVIHEIGGSQDLRGIGRLGGGLPLSRAAFFMASLCLCALPYSSGDFRKDVIFEMISVRYFYFHNTLWLISILRAGLTAFYSVRVFKLRFNGEFRGSFWSVSFVKENLPYSPILIRFCLAGASLLLGYRMREIITRTSHNFNRRISHL